MAFSATWFMFGFLIRFSLILIRKRSRDLSPLMPLNPGAGCTHIIELGQEGCNSMHNERSASRRVSLILSGII